MVVMEIIVLVGFYLAKVFPSMSRGLCFCYLVLISMCDLLGKSHPCRVGCFTISAFTITTSV